MQVPLSSRFCRVRRSFYVISYVRPDWTSCSHQPPKNAPSSSDKEGTQRWSHLSGSKRISALRFFIRWYTSELLSEPGHCQDTKLDLSPFHHRTWLMRSYWPLVRHLKWPINWLYRHRRPSSTRTSPLQTSLKPSPADLCPNLGAVSGNQGWVGCYCLKRIFFCLISPSSFTWLPTS